MSPAIGMPAPAVPPLLDQAYYLGRLYAATPDLVKLEPLNEEDYNTQFWTLTKWTEGIGEGLETTRLQAGKHGQGVNSSFLENEDGERVSVTRQDEILDEARTTWRTMEKFHINLTPNGGLDAPTREYFRRRMAVNCHELRLCANHWKADKVWGQNFSSWRQPTRKPRGQKLQDDNDGLPQPKRRQRKLYEFLCMFERILKYSPVATVPPLKSTCLPPFHPLVPHQLPFKLQESKSPGLQMTRPLTTTVNQERPPSLPNRQTTTTPYPPQPHLPMD